MRRLAQAMLEKLELASAELSVLLTNDAAIRLLNHKHRQKDRATDVLAFPIEDAESSEFLLPSAQERLLGDVVISLDTAERQARSRRRPLAEEVRFLLAHGLLHLIGYDHDTRPKKRAMDAMARALVRSAPLPAELVAVSKRRARSKRGPKRRSQLSRQS